MTKEQEKTKLAAAAGNEGKLAEFQHQHPLWRLFHFQSSSLLVYTTRQQRRAHVRETRTEVQAPDIGLVLSWLL